MSKNNTTKVITGINTRLSYFNGFEPVSINGGPEKYSVSVLIPKDDTETIEAIEKAAYTGEPGDGKIFTYEIRHAQKIRTKETGYDAIQATE